MSTIKYRPEIDGLRALAIISVFIYHIDTSWLPGGFLGVDIFFVISGYLITKIINKNIDSFSLKNFYSRRIKRIAPALFFIIIITLIIGYIILLPSDLYQLTNSAISVVFFSSNLFFSSKADYFAISSEQLPLLHTWSLSVEEQFYFFWPIFLILITKYFSKKNVIRISIILALSSFTLAQYLSSDKDLASYSYYLPFTRAGELLVGAILALYPKIKYKNAYLQPIGLIIIFSSLILFNDNINYPGIAGLIPCIGVAILLIENKKNTLIKRIFSYKPVVGIGLISYSIYLWHWPILAYFRYILDTSILPLNIIIISIFITLALSFFTYHLIEQPARKNKLSSLNKISIRYYIFPSILICIFFLFSYKSLGIPERYGKDTNEYFITGINKPCYILNDNTKGCSFGNTSKNTHKNLLIGDSHASHYAVLLDSLGRKKEFSIDFLSAGGCFPLLDVKADNRNKLLRDQCNQLRNSFRKGLDNYSVVTLAAAWSHHIFEENYLINLENTIKKLIGNNKTVILFAQIPNYKKNYTKRYFSSKGYIKDRYDKSNEYADANKLIFELSKKYKNIIYFDLEKKISNQFLFLPIIDNKPLYLDTNHLSVWGAKFIAEILSKNESTSKQLVLSYRKHSPKLK